MSSAEGDSGIAYLFRGSDILLPPGQGEEGSGGERVTAAWDPGILDRLDPVARRAYRGRPEGHPRCVAARLGPEASPAPPEAEPRVLPFRQALSLLPPAEAAEAAKGLALLNWLETARHCGACGGLLADATEADGDAGEAGARKCPACGRLVFPRVSPAVIVLVRRGDKALFAHNAAFPAGRFGLIAGFVEPGETFEEAARRELLEEASVEVSSLRYVSSQPWPFPDSLMVAFEAEWSAGEGRPDGREITELRWCGAGDLPSIPPPGSVARALIDAFVRGGGSGREAS